MLQQLIRLRLAHLRDQRRASRLVHIHAEKPLPVLLAGAVAHTAHTVVRHELLPARRLTHRCGSAAVPRARRRSHVVSKRALFVVGLL